MASVYFDPAVGGDGSTVTDDRDPTTGLRGGGYQTRFVPALAQAVAVAGNTVTKALEASDSAADALAAAATAVNAPGTNATSTTSHNISTGSKAYTVQTGKLFVPGMRLVIAQTSSPGNANYAYVNTYDSGTGALSVTVDSTTGSGTAITAWTASISGTPGAAGSNANSAMEFVSAATASASATVEFTSLDPAYDYVVVGEGIRPTTDGGLLCMRISTNNGSSYASGGSDYKTVLNNGVGSSGIADDSLTLTATLDSTASGNNCGFEIRICNIGSTTRYKIVMGHSVYAQDGAAGANFQPCGGFYSAALTAINAIQFFTKFSTTIAAGTFRLYRVKRS